MIAAAVNQNARLMVDWMKERFFQKRDDPKVRRIVRYESGAGEVIEIIEVPDPHKAAEYKVPTNDELLPKPGCRFKKKQRLGRVGGATLLFTRVRGRVFSEVCGRDGTAPRCMAS